MTLKEAGITLIDCVHATPTEQPSGYPYIAIPQMKDGTIDFQTARKINERDYVEWTKKAKPQKHDVVLSRRTNPGVTATFGNNTEFALGQNLVLLRANGEAVLPEFLRWLVVSPDWWGQIKKYNNVGAVFDSLKCADVPRFELPIPPRRTQKAISKLLTALAEKIELNRRMNETLEVMAKAIFKDWFIDFGPTRAKMEGKVPYLAPEIWSSFPDEMDDEGIPVGWIQSTIGECFNVVGGSTPSTQQSEFWDGGIAWVTPKDLSSLSSPILLATERTITKAGLAKIGSGLLPLGTVLLSSRAPIGYVAISHIPVAINQGFIALIPNGQLPSEFGFLWVKENMELIKQYANGSTFLEISKTNFRPLHAIIGGSKVIETFRSIVSPMFDKIAANEEESRDLCRLRDLLLPKLMSGEIRLKDAEKAVDAVM